VTARGVATWAAPLACGAFLIAGCGRAPDESRADAHDPARERVLAFWTSFRAATDARIAGDCETAASLYEEALTLDPHHEDSLYYLGQCRRELGDPVAAREAFERLVGLNPASARGHLALGALLASPDPREPMDLAVAETHLRRAHEINGEETGPMVRLGEVLLVRGRRDEARSWFESALRTNPKSVEAALLVGYVDRGASGARAPDALVERVREAVKVKKPVQGVLGEGDRRRIPPAGDESHAAAAPPLESPVGRLLFEAPVLALRARAAEGRPLVTDDVVRAWREIDGVLRECEERTRVSADSRAAGSSSPGP